MTKKQVKVQEPRSEADKKELILAINKLHKSAWKQQRKKLNSEKYKLQFIAAVSGEANASD